MWLLPLLLIGAFVVAAASRSPRERFLPGPIAVLGEMLRLGQVPSPRVILCAVAEAEAHGRRDIVHGIVQSCHRSLARSPRDPRYFLPPPQPSRGTCSPRALADRPLPQLAAPTPPHVITKRAATQDEVLAILHTDPKAFIEIMATGRPALIDVTSDAQGASPVTAPLQPPPPPPLKREEHHVPGSPLGGVPDDAWRDFVGRLEREAPQFESSRHVGQYRQRRERLVELGIDPNAIAGSADRQRAALDADLSDAHAHAKNGDLLAEHLGREITLPGEDAPTKITLSGLLGVIQCAGIEGAVGWLEKPNDRRRFPHTTQAFSRTNGVF